MKNIISNKFIITLITIIAVLIILPCNNAFAQAVTGTPEVFKVTMKKVEVSTDGTTFTTLIEKDQIVDIASVNAGQAAASYASGAQLDPGTYTDMRVTTSKTLSIKGVIYNNNTNNTSWTTAAGSSNNGAGGDDSGDTSNLVGYAETDLDIPAGQLTNGLFVQTITLSTPITITLGSSPTFRVNFDVSDTIQEPGNNTIQLNQPPVVTITQQ